MLPRHTILLEVDLILDLAHLVADVVVAGDVGVRPSPVTGIGHEPLVSKFVVVSALGVSPDSSVVAHDVRGIHEEFDAG